MGVRISDGPLLGAVHVHRLLVTRHGPVTIRTAIHQRNHRFAMGGVRFVRQGSDAEVAWLAQGMTLKARAASIPIDGLKTLVECPDGIPTPLEVRAELIAAHLASVLEVESDVVMGPDMGCPPEVLDRVAEHDGLRSHVTGLSRNAGGLDINRNAFTALGIAEACIRAAPVPHGESRTVAIHGFGAVGAHCARLIVGAAFRVTGVSNIHGALHDSAGLDLGRLFRLWLSDGDGALGAYHRADVTGGSTISPTAVDVFRQDAQVLIPAARTSDIVADPELAHVRQSENPSALPVTTLLRNRQLRLVVEGANHPLSDSAELALEQAGIRVLPDILVNCGGMVACYFEVVHRQRLASDSGAYDTIITDVSARIKGTIGAQLTDMAHRGEGAVAFRRRMRVHGAPATPFTDHPGDSHATQE